MANLNYKGYEITVNGDGEFNCPELELSADKYTTLCSRIDAESKKSYERIPALRLGTRWSGHDGEIEEVTITSPCKSEKGDMFKYVWITNSKKKREKENLNDLRADTPENRKVLTRIIDLRKQADGLRDEADKLLNKASRPAMPTEKKALA